MFISMLSSHQDRVESSIQAVWRSIEKHSEAEGCAVRDIHAALRKLGVTVALETVLAIAGETSSEAAVTGATRVTMEQYAAAYRSLAWAEIRTAVMARQRSLEEGAPEPSGSSILMLGESPSPSPGLPPAPDSAAPAYSPYGDLQLIPPLETMPKAAPSLDRWGGEEEWRNPDLGPRTDATEDEPAAFVEECTPGGVAWGPTRPPPEKPSGVAKGPTRPPPEEPHGHEAPPLPTLPPPPAPPPAEHAVDKVMKSRYTPPTPGTTGRGGARQGGRRVSSASRAPGSV